MEAKMNEHTSWVDNDVHDLVDLRKSSKQVFEGTMILSVMRDKYRKVVKRKAHTGLTGRPGQTKTRPAN